MAIQKEELNAKLLPILANQEIAEKLSACKSPEECYEVAKAYVTDISFVEFQESMAMIKAYMEENKDGFLEISDLAEVAGGTNNDFWTGVAIGAGVGAAAVGAAVGAAAA